MNWPLEQFAGKDIVFVGAGKGRAMAGVQQFLEQYATIASFTGVDKRPGENPLAFLEDYDQDKTIFIKNEGIPGPELSIPYITGLQLFFSLVPLTGAVTIGITGTKGKSTTTALTAHILESAGREVILAGNIGHSPLLDLGMAAADSIFVLELSSYQLADLQTSPHISACINLYNDHSDWHGSIDKYWTAKRNIMRFASANDVFIYNPQFPELETWAIQANCRTVAIDPNQPLGLDNANLFGDHNRLNALVARAIAREFGLNDDIIIPAIHSFVPLSHRMQVVATKNNHTYIDDAIGMTPESTLASLTAVTEKFGNVGCLILGGQDRDYDFTKLMHKVAEQEIPALVLFPNTVEKMRAAMPAGYDPQILEAVDMSSAVTFAAQTAPEKSVVLLSTAAPSYLLWKDFEDKGDQFQAAVMALS